jgi:hypothetical protein
MEKDPEAHSQNFIGRAQEAAYCPKSALMHTLEIPDRTDLILIDVLLYHVNVKLGREPFNLVFFRIPWRIPARHLSPANLARRGLGDHIRVENNM